MGELTLQQLLDARARDTDTPTPAVSDTIKARLAEIEAERAAIPIEDRKALEVAERRAQRESWIRGMAPCEHGMADLEECIECRGGKR